MRLSDGMGILWCGQDRHQLRHSVATAGRARLNEQLVKHHGPATTHGSVDSME